MSKASSWSLVNPAHEGAGAACPPWSCHVESSSPVSCGRSVAVCDRAGHRDTPAEAFKVRFVRDDLPHLAAHLLVAEPARIAEGSNRR